VHASENRVLAGVEAKRKKKAREREKEEKRKKEKEKKRKKRKKKKKRSISGRVKILHTDAPRARITRSLNI